MSPSLIWKIVFSRYLRAEIMFLNIQKIWCKHSPDLYHIFRIFKNIVWARRYLEKTISQNSRGNFSYLTPCIQFIDWLISSCWIQKWDYFWTPEWQNSKVNLRYSGLKTVRFQKWSKVVSENRNQEARNEFQLSETRFRRNHAILDRKCATEIIRNFHLAIDILLL